MKKLLLTFVCTVGSTLCVTFGAHIVNKQAVTPNESSYTSEKEEQNVNDQSVADTNNKPNDNNESASSDLATTSENLNEESINTTNAASDSAIQATKAEENSVQTTEETNSLINTELSKTTNNDSDKEADKNVDKTSNTKNDASTDEAINPGTQSANPDTSTTETSSKEVTTAQPSTTQATTTSQAGTQANTSTKSDVNIDTQVSQNQESAKTQTIAASPTTKVIVQTYGSQANCPTASQTVKGNSSSGKTASANTTANTGTNTNATTSVKPSTANATTNNVPSSNTTPSTTGTSTANSSSLVSENYANQVLVLVNQERAKQGLSALSMTSALQQAAGVRAKETAQSFSHTRPNGSSFSTVLNAYAITYNAAGENIAYGQSTPQEVVTGWMNSPGHRANILNTRFHKIGIGVYKASNGTYYWEQLFTD